MKCFLWGTSFLFQHIHLYALFYSLSLFRNFFHSFFYKIIYNAKFYTPPYSTPPMFHYITSVIIGYNTFFVCFLSLYLSNSLPFSQNILFFVWLKLALKLKKHAQTIFLINHTHIRIYTHTHHWNSHLTRTKTPIYIRIYFPFVCCCCSVKTQPPPQIAKKKQKREATLLHTPYKISYIIVFLHMYSFLSTLSRHLSHIYTHKHTHTLHQLLLEHLSFHNPPSKKQKNK